MSNRIIYGQEPLVLFVGPASCGKSMVLMSLVEYLRNPKLGYTIKPDKTYIASEDYEFACDAFEKTLTENAAIPPGQPKTALDATINEIMVDVLSNGTRCLRMLEAPGEDFFNLSDPQAPIKPYLNTIISRTRTDNYPVYYVMLLNINSGKDNTANKTLLDTTLRGYYEQRLIDIYNSGYNSDRGDKIILLYNKFDLPINPHAPNAFDDLLMKFYPNIKETFRDRFWRTDKYTYLPHITGKCFTDELDDQGNSRQTYHTDSQVTQYTADLWKKIKRWYWK